MSNVYFSPFHCLRFPSSYHHLSVTICKKVENIFKTSYTDNIRFHTLSLSHQMSVKMFNKTIEKRFVEYGLIYNIWFLTLTSCVNSFSLTLDFCTNILWAKVENDGKASSIDITGNVHSVPCTYIDCQALSIARCL